MKEVLIQEAGLARRVWQVTGKRYLSGAIIVCLGLVAALFEGIGLSFLIPLAAFATGNEQTLSIPVVSAVVDQLDAWIGLSATSIVFFVVIFFLLGVIVGYLNLVVSTVVTMNVTHDLRVEVFETTLTRPMTLLEGLTSGKFYNDLANETWQVSEAFNLIIVFLGQFITFLVLLGFLIAISPFYTAILLLITAGMAIVIQFATRRIRGLGEDTVKANEAFMAYAWDTLAGLRVIRGFGQERYERTRFAARSGRIRDVFTRLRILGGVVGPLSQIISVGMVGAILSVAVWRGDPMTHLVGFLAIAYRMQPRVSEFLRAWTDLRGLDASVRSVEQVLSLQFPSGEGTRVFPGLRDGIVFDAVWARYPKGDAPALKDISYHFPIGKLVAVAGYSGAGKSTLVSLLLRFLNPERGQILIDGVPLKDFDPENWHRRIAFVEQNAFLFNASVRENIGYGDIDAGLDEIRQAARLAEADGFVAELPQGYDTMIGEDGFRLSQGQRQRIALARALLRKPDILILDEATNALDLPTEQALRAGIETIEHKQLVIVIAHRRQTIDNADEVVVIDRGRIVETGKPRELQQKGGVYSRLYMKGAGEAETD